jgi:protein TonB
MGLVFALHAGVLGAIILTPPEVIKGVIYKTLITYSVPETKPPEPLPEPMPDKQAPSRIVKIDRIVHTQTIDNSDIIRPLDPLPPLPPLPLPPGPQILPEPPKPAVMTEAQPDPRFAAVLQPPYPSAMARLEIEGRVVIRVLIGTDGRVKAVEPVSATDPAFHEATAAQALRRWRFKPATKDGVPVESWRTMAVRFQLET